MSLVASCFFMLNLQGWQLPAGVAAASKC